MNIDWEHFTPGASFVGGLLIGLATAILLLFYGRIAGISGIIGTLLQRGDVKEKHWRLFFIFGMLIAPLVYRLSYPPLPTITIHANWPLLLIAGLLVGLGTRLSGGCTSGHGICGISRFSKRSIIATLCFMSAGMITVFLMRHFFRG